MSRIFLLSVILTLASFISGQRITSGECPKVTVKKDFDVSQYVGDWYEIEKNPAPFEKGLKCNNAKYEIKGDYVTVLNSGVNTSTGMRSKAEGIATIPDKDVPAKLKVKFDKGPITGDYWILGTDYENYSVVYSCFSFMDIFKGEFLWILSRNPHLDKKTREIAYNLLEKNDVCRDGLIPTVQDCSR